MTLSTKWSLSLRGPLRRSRNSGNSKPQKGKKKPAQEGSQTGVYNRATLNWALVKRRWPTLPERVIQKKKEKEKKSGWHLRCWYWWLRSEVPSWTSAIVQRHVGRRRRRAWAMRCVILVKPLLKWKESSKEETLGVPVTNEITWPAFITAIGRPTTTRRPARPTWEDRQRTTKTKTKHKRKAER